MIELHDIYAIVLCTLLVLALTTTILYHRQKARQWKETEQKLLAEIDRLQKGNNILPPLVKKVKKTSSRPENLC